MITIARRIQQDVALELTPEEFADVFWEQCSDEDQARFFNRLGTQHWLAFQLEAVAKRPALNESGRSAMKLIGEYATKGTPEP